MLNSKLCQSCRKRPATHEVVRAGKRYQRCDTCKAQKLAAERARRDRAA